MSVDRSIMNEDGSLPNDVIDDSSRNSRERISSDDDIASSSNVDDPFGLEVASRDGRVGVLAHLGGSQRDDILIGIGSIASEEETRPLNVDGNVIGVRSASVRISLIARLRSIEVLIEASRNDA